VLFKAKSESKQQAREMVKKGCDILLRLKKSRGLTASQQELLNGIEKDLRKMSNQR
jgi:hypothetical protein